MANNCYIDIQIIGKEDEVEKAEADLKTIFWFAWDEQTKRQKPDGSLLAVRYHPPHQPSCYKSIPHINL